MSSVEVWHVILQRFGQNLLVYLVSALELRLCILWISLLALGAMNSSPIPIRDTPAARAIIPFDMICGRRAVHGLLLG